MKARRIALPQQKKRKSIPHKCSRKDGRGTRKAELIGRKKTRLLPARTSSFFRKGSALPAKRVQSRKMPQEFQEEESMPADQRQPERRKGLSKQVYFYKIDLARISHKLSGNSDNLLGRLRSQMPSSCRFDNVLGHL